MKKADIFSHSYFKALDVFFGHQLMAGINLIAKKLHAVLSWIDLAFISMQLQL